MTPASLVVPVQANPILINTVGYTQPTTPTAQDLQLVGIAQCQGKTGEGSTWLRGVSLQIYKLGPEELYSGTQTGKACCAMYVKAWCPNGSQYCKPGGKILGTVAGEGVWLKWGEGGGWAWGKNREEPLSDGSIPTTPPLLNVRRACFTVATDKPGGLPHDPQTAYFDCQLNTQDSPVTGHEEAPVLVPQELVHPEPAGGEKPVVHSGQEFTGNLVWYAEPNETKYYWGASGTVRWTLPQGECQQTYRQNTQPPTTAYPYSSVQTTLYGEGSRSLTEEHDFSVTVPVKVAESPQSWLDWARALWGEKYTTVDIIVGALALTAKLLTGG
ncbi:MAG: hypothetical protein FJX74_18440 [Armatimonadetes bacterium]|nr:hypothetical protein [Armatimonadota bacterium]